MIDSDGLTDGKILKEHVLIDKVYTPLVNNKMLMEIGELVHIIISTK